MKFDYLKQFMDEMAAEHAPGNAIEVYVGGKSVFRYAAGYSDLETKTPMTGDEYFHIYSTSKITTVVAALQLLEQGKYLLHDPLYYYIPEFRNMTIKKENGEIVKAENPITIANLFTMTAGFDYDTDREAFAKTKKKTNGKMDTLELVRALAEEPLCFEPGSRWQYSLCHDVLAGFVCAVSGMKFRDYVAKNIFGPLEMNHSTYHPTPEIEEKMASQYTYMLNPNWPEEDRLRAEKCGGIREGWFENTGKKNTSHMGPEFESGGGGVISTVPDYAKLMAALANFGLGVNGERILSKGTVELLRTNQLNEAQMKDFNWSEFRGCGYGLGVYTMMDRAKAGFVGSLGEFGWGGAAGATAFADPERNLGVFFAQHCLNPREEYYQPRLKNVIQACMDR